MILSNLISSSDSGEYSCLKNLDLYAESNCQELATQASINRQLKIISTNPVNEAVEICLCEDNYSAWLPLKNLQYLQPAMKPYEAISYNREQIEAKIPKVIEFAKNAMNVPNYYLWGGTVAPNYDCSGLIQSAFASVGIWLPRDSYQQEEFTTRIQEDELEIGDLIFFGTKKVSHVALYLGNKSYLHSSGKQIGNNKIAINFLANNQDKVSKNYYEQLWSFGRVNENLKNSNNK
jgi:hypothetical protein